MDWKRAKIRLGKTRFACKHSIKTSASCGIYDTTRTSIFPNHLLSKASTSLPKGMGDVSRHLDKLLEYLHYAT